MIEHVTNEDILDLACGAGYYTRIIREKTTGEVFGADISPDMITLANKIQSEDTIKGKSILYMVHDCCIPIPIDLKLDIVCGTYLLQNANTKEMLTKFIENVYNVLKPGGKFIGLNLGMNWNETDNEVLKDHGYHVSGLRGDQEEGDKLTYTIETGGSKVDGVFYYLSEKTYQDVFEKVGFKEYTYFKESPENVEDEWKAICPHVKCYGFSAIK